MKTPVTVIRIVCAWHKKNFGFELDMGTKDGMGETGISHSMCDKCREIRRQERADRLAARTAVNVRG